MMDHFHVPELCELEEDRRNKLKSMRKRKRKQYEEVEFATLLEEEKEKLKNELV